MQKLLVAIDGSKVSDRVVRFAAMLKKTAFITLLYVGLDIQKYSIIDPDSFVRFLLQVCKKS